MPDLLEEPRRNISGNLKSLPSSSHFLYKYINLLVMNIYTAGINLQDIDWIYSAVPERYPHDGVLPLAGVSVSPKPSGIAARAEAARKSALRVTRV
jgi:hypothetical protein